MAGAAKRTQNNSSLEKSRPKKALSGAEYVAVRLYASGKTRSQVAKVLGPRLYGDLDKVEAEKAMRKRLRQWEETQWFRDSVYDYAINLTDLDVPRILNGVRQRARRGRVDAARLVLEVTGRHNPRGEAAAPAVVQVNFAGAVPRPESRTIDDGQEAQLYGPQALPPADLEIEDAEVVEEPSNSSPGRSSRLPWRKAI